MKKTYFAPNTTIVVLNSKQTLLTGSSAVSGLVTATMPTPAAAASGTMRSDSPQ